MYVGICLTLLKHTKPCWYYCYYCYYILLLGPIIFWAYYYSLIMIIIKCFKKDLDWKEEIVKSSIDNTMPVNWPCPAFPDCSRSFPYPASLRAHILSCPLGSALVQTPCPNGQDERLAHRKMADVVLFVNEKNQGSTKITRSNAVEFKTIPRFKPKYYSRE